MKKTLMSIVLGAAAMVLMVGGVKADAGCVLAPGEDTNTCQASVDGTGYDTLTNALKAANENGGEVTVYLKNGYILGNSSDYEITNNVTIDLYDDDAVSLTLGSTSHSVIVKEGGSLTLKGENITVAKKIVVEEGASLTIDGKVNVTGGNMVETSGDVTITAGSEINAASKNVVIAKAGSKVTLDGTINAKTIATYSAVAALETPAAITVNGGKITATDVAFNVANNGSLTVNGGDIKAAKQAILILEGAVAINGGNVTSTGNYAVQTNKVGTNKASLTIKDGTIVSGANPGYALYLNNDEATYDLAGGTVKSMGNDEAAAILLGDNMFDIKTGELKANLQGIITGGSYLNKIVAVLRNKVTGANMDVSAQLVKAGVKIETVDGYVVVGEGTPAEQPEDSTTSNGTNGRWRKS